MKSAKAKKAHVQTTWFLPNSMTGINMKGAALAGPFFMRVAGGFRFSFLTQINADFHGLFFTMKNMGKENPASIMMHLLRGLFEVG